VSEVNEVKRKSLMIPDAKNKLAEMVASRIENVRSVCRDQSEFEKIVSHCVIALNEIDPKYVSQNQSHTALIAAYNAIAIGLSPGKHLGLAYFIPCNGKLRLEIGYKGYLQLGFRNKFLSVCKMELVFKGEDFLYRMTDRGPVIDHVIQDRDIRKARQEVTHSYCYYETVTGGRSVDVCFRSELDAVDSNEHVWVSHYGPMASKSAIRKSSKCWMLDSQTREALALDEQNYIAGAEQFPLSVLGDLVEGIKMIARQEPIGFDRFNKRADDSGGGGDDR